MHSQSLLASHDLGSAIADLGQGANWLAGASLSRLRELADECSLGVVRVAKDWVRAACEAKHIGFDQPVAAEEILSGPTAVLRYLRVMSLVFQAVESTGLPTLPGRPRTNSQGRLCVPVLPVDSMFDRLTFFGLKAEVWRQAGASDTDLFSNSWETSITQLARSRASWALATLVRFQPPIRSIKSFTIAKQSFSNSIQSTTTSNRFSKTLLAHLSKQN